MADSFRTREDRINESYLADLMSNFARTDSYDLLDGIRFHMDEFNKGSLDHFFNKSLYAPPMAKLYHELDMMPPLASNKQGDHWARRSLALRRNVTKLLHEQVTKRREWGGNLVLEWTGPTGIGKSSCMLGFMEKHNGLRDVVLAEGTEGLRKHIAIDVPNLPAKLAPLKRGQAVALDEQLHLVGDGARNAMDTLANLEETLRGTGIDIHFASPSLREHTTSQGILEALSWSREHKVTAFLYKLAMSGNPEPQPLGYAILPWCSDEVFQAYGPIKEENLERTRKMQFNAGATTQDELIRRFFDEPAVQARFRVKTPTVDDLDRWWARHMPSVGNNERATYASEIHDMARTIRNAVQEFRPIYGWDPTPNMISCIKRTDPESTGKKTLGGNDP